MREHSRVELRRKLMPHAESAEQVDAVLEELEGRKLLSAERFAESVVHRKASRFGVARIQAELSQHQLPSDVAAAVVRTLRDTEFERAHRLWERRYGVLPLDATERARQARFLAARGFSTDVIRRVLKGECPAEDPDGFA
jgi:regulatory protein